MKRVRTRYAPSPTGKLHIGGARTALFSYLYAKHYGGQFIIRIEDTDLARNEAIGETSQLENLTWLGVIADESPLQPDPKYGPYRQSSKLKRYQKLAETLIANGRAYKAYDNSDELIKQRKEQQAKGLFSFRYDPDWLQLSASERARRETNKAYVVRLQLKSNTTYEWDDLVRGMIKVNTTDIGDFVILKQNGYPTYNFAVAIDDHDMAISHVLRGEEHISNTPKQLAVYDAFKWIVPRFGHLTVITNMDGRKLSKRDLGTKSFVSQYRQLGYSSEALFNFLALLGWSHPEAKEVMTKAEIVAAFDPARLSRSPSKFDARKLEWFCKNHLKNTANDVLAQKLIFQNRSPEWIDLFITTYKQSASSISDLQKAVAIYGDNTVRKTRAHNGVVAAFAQELGKHPFTPVGINAAITSTGHITEQKGKALYMPIRAATTYQKHGPELAKAIYLCGETLVKKRLA